MRLSSVLVLLLLNLTLSGATYYIDPAGNDSNTGSSSSPWKTLAYACSKATASGDIIHVNAGTYTETNQCVLAVGVSIEGVGVTSHIISKVVFTRSGDLTGAAITLSSGSEGTNGNQHISGIWLDGNYFAGATYDNSATGNDGIFVQRRSNVKIYNCTVSGFYLNGIALHGSTTYAQPSIYATGNEIYNCIITDNGNEDNTWGGGGNIEIGGQGDGTLIHDNTISAIGRQNYGLINGNNLSGAHHNKGVKFYNNVLNKREQEGVWSFQIEMWNTDGGFEVYGNTFNGGDTQIDIAGDWNLKGNYDYSWYIHDNVFTGEYSTSYQKKVGIDIENGHIEDVWIYRNHFVNKHAPFNITNGTDANVIIERIYFAYNIMESCGYGVKGDYKVINNFHIPSDMTFTDFYFYNNVITGRADAYYTAFYVDNAGVANNFYFKNNIVVNFLHPAQAWLYVNNTGTMNGLYVDNNILYNNANNSDPILTGNKVNNYEFLNNLKVNPLFVSSTDFHLQATSPAIGKGLTLAGLTTDYSGKTLNIPPSIGAYESGSTAVVPAAIPVYQNSVVANAAPSSLAMTYNMTLANIVPVVSAFSVRVNSVVRTVTAVAVSGTQVKLTLASPVVSGDAVTVTYTLPSTNPLQTTSGGIAASISNQAVSNNRINIAPTALITSPVTNSSFTALSSITITASASDADGSIGVVEFYSGSTRLGSKSAAPYTFTWSNVAAGTYSLTAIATDNLSMKTTSPAIAVSVTSNKPTANRHPIVKISNPRKGIVYDNLSTITIDAIASDPDGIVNKVEFYNGMVKLVELTSAPYTYTWKDVAAGSYSITAIATDNLNDTTISTPVEFVVGSRVKYDANSDIVKLYPNPNDGHFSIELLTPLLNEKSEIVITDMAGKQVYNGPLSKEETLKQFDLSGSKSGVYVMLIKDKEILVTKKFIKN